tara:strand:+ start:1001 stop:1204 length:204 start_codon:yes stop_codon:yes gene_type:complete
LASHGCEEYEHGTHGTRLSQTTRDAAREKSPSLSSCTPTEVSGDAIVASTFVERWTVSCAPVTLSVQ